MLFDLGLTGTNRIMATVQNSNNYRLEDAGSGETFEDILGKDGSADEEYRYVGDGPSNPSSPVSIPNEEYLPKIMDGARVLGLNRVSAEMILSQKKSAGSFLFRKSAQDPDLIILSFVNKKKKVDHAKIKYDKRGAWVSGDNDVQFPNLVALRDHYMFKKNPGKTIGRLSTEVDPSNLAATSVASGKTKKDMKAFEKAKAKGKHMGKQSKQPSVPSNGILRATRSSSHNSKATSTQSPTSSNNQKRASSFTDDTRQHPTTSRERSSSEPQHLRGTEPLPAVPEGITPFHTAYKPGMYDNSDDDKDEEDDDFGINLGALADKRRLESQRRKRSSGSGTSHNNNNNQDGKTSSRGNDSSNLAIPEDSDDDDGSKEHEETYSKMTHAAKKGSTTSVGSLSGTLGKKADARDYVNMGKIYVPEPTSNDAGPLQQEESDETYSSMAHFDPHPNSNNIDNSNSNNNSYNTMGGGDSDGDNLDDYEDADDALDYENAEAIIAHAAGGSIVDTIKGSNSSGSTSGSSSRRAAAVQRKPPAVVRPPVAVAANDEDDYEPMQPQLHATTTTVTTRRQQQQQPLPPGKRVSRIALAAAASADDDSDDEEADGYIKPNMDAPLPKTPNTASSARKGSSLYVEPNQEDKNVGEALRAAKEAGALPPLPGVPQQPVLPGMMAALQRQNTIEFERERQRKMLTRNQKA